MDRLLERRPTKGMMLLGLRGVGKTVLLNRLQCLRAEVTKTKRELELPAKAAS